MPLNKFVEQIKSGPSSLQPELLITLVDEIGIHDRNNVDFISKNLNQLAEILISQPEIAEELRNYLYGLYSNYDALSLYTDSGILPGHGFFAEAYKRMEYKLLPPLADISKLEHLIRLVFYNKTDYGNIASVDESVWLNLFKAIDFDPDSLNWQSKNINCLLNAMMVLSHRITAIGLEPEVIDKLPALDDMQSPFFGLNREVQHYVDSFKSDVSYIHTNEEDYLQILVMCTQCTESISELHKHKEKYGISIHLAYLILRLEQHIKRLKTILKLIQKKNSSEFNLLLFEFMDELLYAENKKYSVRKHLNNNLSLIAYKITEHTSRVGDHYRAVNFSEYYSMLLSAMGGGLIVAFIVLLKVFAHHLNLPPFGEAFLYSLIYAVGFIVIQLLHFTLATKQPAMTANTIAASLDDTRKSDKQMLNSVQLIAEISRAQIISLFGNILVVLPFSYLIGLIFYFINGYNVVSPEEAHDMLMSLHPWYSGSLFYAALAGVFLMSSGIIAGYYDNKFVYGRIPERIQQHSFLKKIFSGSQLLKFSGYLKNNAGVLISNVFLGIFLATSSLFGRFFGLPIDVRHVTLSAGNFGLALQANQGNISVNLMVILCFSLLMMGGINLLVSFGLSIYVAVRSRSLNISLMRRISKAITIYFISKPLDFILPPMGINKKKQMDDDK